ncbi:MAG: N-acetylmuramoyl-L-alanine amidase [Armatimonadetes bacterium]|nr:N-acetylmuramoyl-L-alanine amidase [Armatimonadota bacterium]
MQQYSSHIRPAFVFAALIIGAVATADVQVRIMGRAATVAPAPVLCDGHLEGSPLPFIELLGCRRVAGRGDGVTIVTPDDTRIELTPGADEISVNDGPVALPDAVRVVEGRIWCALRPVLEAMGCEVRWDGAAQALDLWARVTDIKVRADRRGCEVAVRTSLPVEGTLASIPDPERWYVDLQGAFISLEHDRTWVSTGRVRRVRWGQFDDAPPVARVVADLSGSARVRWRARRDGRGGSIIIGRVDGDEPIIDRPLPGITGLTAVVPNQRVTRLRVSMTDPVDFSWQVLRRPPRVIFDFPDAVIDAETGVIPVAGPFVESAELRGRNGEPGTTLTLNMRQLIQFEVRQYDDPAVVDVIFKRERLRDKRVVLDPGHGDHDSGARGERLLEKDVNLDVALRAAAKLVEMGAQVRLTRESDVFVDLFDRPAMANEMGADLFVSIHCNAMPTPNTGHGTETYYYTPQSMCLGQIMQSALVDALGRSDRGLRRARFVVIREATMPAVLVELMFLNDEEEHALLERPEVRQAAADAICEGLRQYVEGTGLPGRQEELGY